MSTENVEHAAARLARTDMSVTNVLSMQLA